MAGAYKFYLLYSLGEEEAGWTSTVVLPLPVLAAVLFRWFTEKMVCVGFVQLYNMCMCNIQHSV